MRTYKVNLKMYGIDKYRRDELIAFCRQYNWKKEKLKSISGSPEYIAKLKNDIAIIENSAAEVDKKSASCILDSVSGACTYTELKEKYGASALKGFFEKRRLFYCLVNEKK